MWIIVISIVSIILYLIYDTVRNIKLLRTVTRLNRGTWSERDLILRLLKEGVSSDKIFHDLFIEKKDGTYSQIDIVVLTEVGFVVIEVKDFSGWIFGFGNNEKWVHILGKMKYPFYNPVFQNDGHIRNLKNKISKSDNISFYSLIVFYGNCELKKISNIPNTTFVIKSNKLIKTFNSILQNQNTLDCNNMSDSIEVLNVGVKNGGVKEIKSQHIQDLKKYS
jgi:hypothetical protein